MVPVERELHVGSVDRDAVCAEGLGDRFEEADEQAPGLLLHVGAVVCVAQHRQVRRQVRDAVGDQVEVLAGGQRDVDADVPAQLV